MRSSFNQFEDKSLDEDKNLEELLISTGYTSYDNYDIRLYLDSAVPGTCQGGIPVFLE